MAEIQWKRPMSGSFHRAGDWAGGIVPGASDDALLTVAGADYTVSCTGSELVNSVQLTANATLSVSAGRFTASNGTGAGENAGAVDLTGTTTFFVGGTVDNVGTISLDNSGTSQSTATTMMLLSDTTLSGGGGVTLSDSFFNDIIGNGVTLTNVDNLISGAGVIGSSKGGLTFVNEAGGVVDATGLDGLSFGSLSGIGLRGTITNDGVLEETGGSGSFGLLLGASVIDGAGGQIIAYGGSSVTINASTVTGQSLRTYSSGEIQLSAGTVTVGTLCVNDGVLLVQGGNLALDGGLENEGVLNTQRGVLSVGAAVTGAGHALLSGGKLEFLSAFSQNVEFSNPQTRATLVLGQSQSYGGELIDFSYNSRDTVAPDKATLDLRDISFVGSGEATFSGTSTSGVLTVTDGSHTAHIILEGDYRFATFLASSDNQGGADVVVSAVTSHAKPPTPNRFVHAMASFAGSAGAVSAATAETYDAGRLLLAAPRVATV
jgi:hypothetical protein